MHSRPSTDPSRTTDSELTHTFARLAQAFSAFVEKAGVRIKPLASPELPFFSALDSSRKRAVIEELQSMIAVFQSMEEEGLSLRDTPKLTWRAVRQLRMTPCPDIFDKMTADDVVVIYSPQNKVLFYNMRFLELHTFSIEELHCSEWYRLSTRPEWAHDAILALAGPLYAGEIPGTIDPYLPWHVVEEISSGGSNRLTLKLKYLSPVTKDNQVAGVIGVQEMAHAL
jgi:hypothetical protein